MRHERGQNFKCSTCYKGLALKNRLDNHTKIVHGGESEGHSCKKCSKLFSQKGSLTMHIKEMYQKGRGLNVQRASNCLAGRPICNNILTYCME